MNLDTLVEPSASSGASCGNGTQPAKSAGTASGGRWLFSAPVDLAAFLGSAIVSLLLLAMGARFGWLHAETPEWTWIAGVLLVDVAHVYATGFRVYFDRAEFERRFTLYLLVPLLSYVVAVAIYSEGERLFWRVLAYLAVFHFVRQQYGWVALYRARLGERDRLGWWIDASAVYLATIYPLVDWHAHLPRNFWWFLEGDFAPLPSLVATVVQPLYWIALAAYFARALVRGWVNGLWNPGKDLVVATTAVCWYLGIIACNSDYAFTVTNVIIHGVPYLVLVYWYSTSRGGAVRRYFRGGRVSRWGRAGLFLLTVWLLAYTEEMLWDRGVWHERAWLFGSAWGWTEAKVWLIPLLAVPQVTHYVLDGFIWRRRSNPDVARLASASAGAASAG